MVLIKKADRPRQCADCKTEFCSVVGSFAKT